MQLEFFPLQPSTEPAKTESETWLTVVGFPRYEVSSLGRFRNRATGRLLGGSLAHNGYLHIGLTTNGTQITKLAHRLIAETFLTKPSSNHNDVNHRNKIRNDNRVVNLEWLTRSDNSRHAKAK